MTFKQLLSRGARRAAAILVISQCCLATFPAQSPVESPLEFVPKHRVNAHGDEYNALARSVDGRRLIIGSEKGDVIVWSVESQKIEKVLHQQSPVHLVVALSDPRYVVAAGSYHRKPTNTSVRKWDLEKGTFEELAGLPDDSFPSTLATENASGLVAVGETEGTIVVWESSSGKVVATSKSENVPVALALIGRRLFVSSMSREEMLADSMPDENQLSEFDVDQPAKGMMEFKRLPGGFWTQLAVSPDQKLLAASYTGERTGEHTVVIDPHSKSELGTFSGSSVAWINASSLVLFDAMDPTELVQIDAKGKAVSARKFGRMQSDTEGRTFEQTGQVASADGTKAWASYRKGAGFLEFDLATNKIKTLIGTRTGAYAISALTRDGNEGTLATGGADGFVRVWNLADVTLRKEHHVAAADQFVSDVALLPDGKRAVVSLMPAGKMETPPTDAQREIVLLNLETGERKGLLKLGWISAHLSVVDGRLLYPAFDRFVLRAIDSDQVIREFVVKKPIAKSAISANGKWLAVFDDAKTLHVFEVETGRKILTKPIKLDHSGPMVITNDGRYIYMTFNHGQLMRWDTATGALSESILTRLREMSSRSDFMTLANDDKWLVATGNHGDVAIFDRVSGAPVSDWRSSATVFYVEKVWVNGDRLIYTTDSGVMFDGRLVKEGAGESP